MLVPNSILFMSSFESVCLSRGITPTVPLFVSFFRLVRASHCFYYFSPRGGLSIFSGHKDSIKGWMEGFVVVELRKESGLVWDLELSWEEVALNCNDPPQLSLTEQVGFVWLTSIEKKYDVEKCMFVSNLHDISEAGILLHSVVLFCLGNLCGKLSCSVLISHFCSFRREDGTDQAPEEPRIIP